MTTFAQSLLGRAMFRGGGLAGKGVKRLAAGTVHSFKTAPIHSAVSVGLGATILPSLGRTEEDMAEVAATRGDARQRALTLKETQMSQGMPKNASARQVIRGLGRVYGDGPEKTAAAGSAAAKKVKDLSHLNVKQMFLLGAGVALGNQVVGHLAAGAEEGAQRVSDAYRATTRPARWKAVLKYDPDLKNMPFAQDAFAAIDRASPYLAGEPLLAAGAVRTLVTSGSAYEGGPPVINTQTVKNVIDIQNQRTNSRAKPSTTAFSSAKINDAWSSGG